MEQALAIRMYTFETFNQQVRVYAAVNNGFYDPDRCKETLKRELPYLKLLITSLRSLGQAKGYFHGTLYRGARLQNSSYLQKVYDSFVNNEADRVQENCILRFPSFTSTSEIRDVAEENFGNDIVYIINILKGHNVGVSVSDLSYFQEGEVLLIPPASFVVTDVKMVDYSLHIHLESTENSFSYC